MIALAPPTFSGVSTTQPGEVRRFKKCFDGAASWKCVECIIARASTSAPWSDIRFVVSNTAGENAKAL
ncbi:hypothetical protein X747_30650 [Mesorhizobium sp. LNJC384A00]|nr:hypothetical protein X747_30650 [Mesorhizobium sp. LNJC384A00]